MNTRNYRKNEKQNDLSFKNRNEKDNLIINDSNLTIDEKKIVQELIKKMGKGDIIIRHILSKQIEIMWHKYYLKYEKFYKGITQLIVERNNSSDN
jgi:hypothetical protein